MKFTVIDERSPVIAIADSASHGDDALMMDHFTGKVKL